MKPFPTELPKSEKRFEVSLGIFFNNFLFFHWIPYFLRITSFSFSFSFFVSFRFVFFFSAISSLFDLFYLLPFCLFCLSALSILFEYFSYTSLALFFSQTFLFLSFLILSFHGKKSHRQKGFLLSLVPLGIWPWEPFLSILILIYCVIMNSISVF